MQPHRLAPLLDPRSIAVIGATDRPGSAGAVLLQQIEQAGYQGAVYPVHPRHAVLRSLECFADLGDLPECPDLVIFAIPNEAIEAELDKAITLGIPAGIIYSTLQLAGEGESPLCERVRSRAADAGFLLCGGNGMGFYNFVTGLWACAYATRPDHLLGGVALITHSGSVFNSLLDADGRIDFNYAISPGQELTVTAADYLDYVLDQPSTKVVGMVVETVRDPAGFVAALKKAQARRIPIVMLKLGRTARSAPLALSHSGALIGQYGAYRAVFDRFGVCEVATIEELAFTLILFQRCWPLGPGGLATIHDSGGERILFVDLAADHGVSLADLTEQTRARIQQRLEPGMLAVNPLDAWGTGRDNDALYRDSFVDLACDPTVALAAIIGDRAAEGVVSPEYRGYLELAHQASGKPVCLVSNHQGCGDDTEAVALTRLGFPAIDGVDPFLKAVGQLFHFRDAPPIQATAMPDDLLEHLPKAVRRLEAHDQLGEAMALALLGALGIPVNPSFPAADEDQAAAAAAQLGYPVVLKTGADSLAHKSEVGGVKLNLTSEAAVRAAYRDLADRIAPQVIVAPMVTGGIEMLLGVTQDPQFGPILAVGFGGIHAEFDPDVVFLLPPVGPEGALSAIRRLRKAAILNGVRGSPPSSVRGLAAVISRLSLIASALGPSLGDLDINPLLVLADRCVALDAFVSHSVEFTRERAWQP